MEIDIRQFEDDFNAVQGTLAPALRFIARLPKWVPEWVQRAALSYFCRIWSRAYVRTLESEQALVWSGTPLPGYEHWFEQLNRHFIEHHAEMQSLFVALPGMNLDRWVDQWVPRVQAHFEFLRGVNARIDEREARSPRH